MNFNNPITPTSFSTRLDVRKLIPVSSLKLDYQLQVGGYSYLPNTSFKTVLNRIASELSMASTLGANSALSNLASVAINTALIPGTSDGAALGSTTKQWSDIFLAEGGVINWDNGDATLTQVGNAVTLAGANLVVDTLTINTSLLPDANDGAVLGSTTLQFSDLFLAEGGVINWDNGDLTLTQSGDSLTVAGGSLVVSDLIINTQILPDANDGAILGSTSLSFSDLFLASGAVINFNNGNATLTHSTGALTSNVDISVPDEAYDATAWNGSLGVPTKNAVRDKIEALGTISSGTYTPTGTAVTNVDAVTPSIAQYLRIGSTVNVSGYVAIDPTASAALTEVRLTLPIASNFSTDAQLGGAGSSAIGTAIAVYSDATNDQAFFSLTSVGTGNTRYYYSYTYQII